jgi:hypothetical protein
MVIKLFSIFLLALVLRTNSQEEELVKVENVDTNQTEAVDNKNTTEVIKTAADEEKDWEQLFNDIRGYRLRSEQEINFLLKVTDLTFLRFIYRKGSPKSRTVAKHLQNINKRLAGLVGIMQIDCDTFQPQDYSQCQDNPYLADSYPRLKLLIPPENRFDPITKELENYYEFPWKDIDLTEENLYTFITSNMPFLIKKVDEENIHTFLNNNLFNKVLIFTNKKTPSVLFKGLTNFYYDKLLFTEIHESNKALVNRFNVTKFPTVKVYKVFDHARLLDEPEILDYNGLMKTEKLMEFLNQHALKEKRYVSEGRKIYEDDARHIAGNIDLREINEENYQDYFNKNSDRHIMVFFNTHDSMKLIYKAHLVKNQ